MFFFGVIQFAGVIMLIHNLYCVGMLHVFIAGRARNGFKVQLLDVLTGTLSYRQLLGQDARDD